MLEIKNIKTITIDFWNTLYDSSAGSDRNRERQLAIISEVDKFDPFLPADYINGAIEASWKNFEHFWQIHQITPSAEDTAKYIWKYLKMPQSDESILNITKVLEEGILNYSPKPLAQVTKVLPELTKKYNIALISDTGFSPGKVIRLLLEKDGLLNCFNAFSFSNETGVSKPNPKAFYSALEPLNTEVENSVHIGDIEHTDIIGAKKIGMKAIRFSGDLTKLTQKNSDKSQADLEVFSWEEIAQILL